LLNLIPPAGRADRARKPSFMQGAQTEPRS
jgi:hypothetical protein